MSPVVFFCVVAVQLSCDGVAIQYHELFLSPLLFFFLFFGCCCLAGGGWWWTGGVEFLYELTGVLFNCT